MLSKTLAFVNNVVIKHRMLLLCWLRKAVYEDSKQLVKTILLFPDKNTAYRRCRPNNSPN